MKFIKKSLAAITLLAVLCLPATSVFAQSNGIGVTPRFNVTVKKGEKIDQKAFVTNPSQDLPLTLKIKLVDFKAKDDSGEPQFVPANETTPWSLKNFVTIQDSITIGPKQSENIPFSISIPEGQGAGSYYSAIQFSSANEQSETSQQVSLSATNTSLLFVNVPGDAKESLVLEKFGPTEGGKFKTSFRNSPSVLSYRLKNEGNVAVQPNGGIVLRDSFGKQVKVIDRANLRKELAIIGQTRRIDVCINDKKNSDGNPSGDCEATKLRPGRYTAEMTLLYGENSTKEISAKVSFWVLPAWFVFVTVLLIALILLAGYFLYRKIVGAGKNRRISRSARR
jgi:hypothetical protein